MTNTKKESIFKVDAVKRQKEQEQMVQKLSKPHTESTSTRKVPINLALPTVYKERLLSYAKEKHLSASVLLQLWIDEHCV